MLNVSKKVIVRTDLIGEHDYLDYVAEYKWYLEVIQEYFNGYISLYHFQKIFAGIADERYLKETAQRLIKNKWLGRISISKYNFLYLKRKATICLSENVRHGDLKAPSMKQIMRSLMLAEIHLNHFLVMPSIYKRYENDIYLLNEIEGIYTVAVLDIIKRNEDELYRLIQGIMVHQDFIDKRLRIVFCSYEGRFDVLQKNLQNEKIQDIMLISNCFYNNKEHINLKIEAEELNVLKFFNEKEPIL